MASSGTIDPSTKAARPQTVGGGGRTRTGTPCIRRSTNLYCEDEDCGPPSRYTFLLIFRILITIVPISFFLLLLMSISHKVVTVGGLGDSFAFYLQRINEIIFGRWSLLTTWWGNPARPVPGIYLSLGTEIPPGPVTGSKDSVFTPSTIF